MKTESLRSRFDRALVNWLPAYRGTGARMIHLSADYLEATLELPLSWRTRNLLGTTFGGSLYASVDPVFAYMLMRALGKKYAVWDQAATIRFRRPGRGTLFANFRIEPPELERIRTTLAVVPSLTCQFEVSLVDRGGVPHATVAKTIYVANRAAWAQRWAPESAASGERWRRRRLGKEQAGAA